VQCYILRLITLYAVNTQMMKRAGLVIKAWLRSIQHGFSQERTEGNKHTMFSLVKPLCFEQTAAQMQSVC
jgi:hypothetical protein